MILRLPLNLPYGLADSGNTYWPDGSPLRLIYPQDGDAPSLERQGCLEITPEQIAAYEPGENQLPARGVTPEPTPPPGSDNTVTTPIIPSGTPKDPPPAPPAPSDPSEDNTATAQADNTSTPQAEPLAN